MEFKYPSLDNHENPFASSFKSNFMTIYSFINEALGLQSSFLCNIYGLKFFEVHKHTPRSNY